MWSDIKENQGYFWAGVVLVLVILLIPLLPGYRGEVWTPEVAGVFGDFVGGAIGTVVSVATLIVVLITYRSAKEEHAKAEQDRIKQLFESRFFHFLGFFEEAVLKTTFNLKEGKGAFTELLIKWDQLYSIISEAAKVANISPSKSELSRFVYVVFYYGGYPAYSGDADAYLRDWDADALSKIKMSLKDQMEEHFKSHEEESDVLYNGSQTALSSFFRQLYQLYAFIDRECPESHKYFFAKMVRSGLTAQQQTLLAVNIVVGHGAAWINDGFLAKYLPIKNIPNHIFRNNIGVDVKAIFPHLTFEFEESHKHQPIKID